MRRRLTKLFTRRPKIRQQARTRSYVEALESRVLLSADPSGDEFLVNTNVTSLQVGNRFSQQSIDANDSGDAIVVWSSLFQDGSSWGIYGQRLDGDGNLVGDEFLINQTTAFGQRSPVVSMRDDGQFVVTWESFAQDGSGFGVYGRVYGSDGTALTDEFLINQTTAGHQHQPTVAWLDDGGIAVAWSGRGSGDRWGVYARVFEEDGTARTDEVLVNSTTAGWQTRPAITATSDGGVAIAWQGRGNGDRRGIFLRRFDSELNASSGELRVNETTTSFQGSPTITSNADGEVLVAWQSLRQDGSRWGIFANRFDADGDTVGGEFQVNSTTDRSQRTPFAEYKADGGFVIGWAGYGDSDNYGVMIRQYDETGTAEGTDELVNTTTTGFQGLPGIAADGLGFTVIWTGNGTGDHFGIFGQRFVENTAPVLDAIDDQTVDEGDTITVTASATDAEGDTFTFALDTTDLPGTASIDADTGEFTWVTNEEAGPGTYTVTISVTDSDNNSSSVSFDVTVNEVNEPPVLDTIADQTVDQTFEVTFTATATDADLPANTLTFSLSGEPTGAVIDADTGIFTWTPTTSQLGDFTFTVIVSDGTTTAEQEVTITVTEPVIPNQTFSIDESSADTTSVGTVVTNSGATLTYSITSGNDAGGFTINSSTGEITVADMSVLDFETTPTFELIVEVTDGGSITESATITINLNDVNEAPVVDDQTFSIDENSADTTSVGTVVATDVDAGDSLTYAITGSSVAGAFDIDSSTGEITVLDMSLLDFETNPSITLDIEVTDSGSLMDTATITIDLNDLPLIEDQSFTIDENSADMTSVGTVALNDDDGLTLMYSITAGNDLGAFTIDTGTGEITVVDGTQLDFETTPTFLLTVEVTDGGSVTETATITIDLNDINEAPVVDDQTFTIDENLADDASVGTVAASDVDDSDALTYVITAGNDSGAFAIDPATGEITVADSSLLDFETTPSFSLTVEVTDGGSLADTATITIDLNDINEAPVVNDQAFVIDENSAINTSVGFVSADDEDDMDTLNYSIISGNDAGGFAINDTTGEITVADDSVLDFETTPVFILIIQVEDGDGLTDTAQITINLNDLTE